MLDGRAAPGGSPRERMTRGGIGATQSVVDPRTHQPGSVPPSRSSPARPAAYSRWWRPQRRSAVRIAGLYAAIGVAWVTFSDRALAALVHEPSSRLPLQTVKGGLFILLTAALLLLLIDRTERRMRALSAEVRATVDSMADCVLVVDDRFRIVEANRAAVTLLGVPSKGEILGPLDQWARRFQLRAPDGSPIPLDGDVRALAGGAASRFEAIVRRGDGRDVYVSVAAAPVARVRLPPFAVAVLRDVSAVRRLDEMREEFLATAAHEFKTPLAVIKAYAQLMQKREPAERQPLTVILRQVDRLARLVQHLLDTSRLRLDPPHGGPEREERFDLAALAREIVEGMRPCAPGHRLEVSAPAPVPVRADRARIGRVITSLVDNAIRFSPGGGPVLTRVQADDGVARVSVVDRGLGIPADRQAGVFQRYYRAHAGTSHDYGGLGIGLDTSREAVERHGGQLWFESAPGEGSTFHFGLPVDRGDP